MVKERHRQRIKMGRNPFGIQHRFTLVLIAIGLVFNVGCGAQDISEDSALHVVPKSDDYILAPELDPEVVGTSSSEKTEFHNTSIENKEVESLDTPYEDNVPEAKLPSLGRSGAYIQDLDEPMVESRANLEEDLGEFAHIDGRTSPSTTYNVNGQAYVITEARLRQLRSRKLYPFYDLGGDENIGDYQRDIHSGTTQVHKNFNFQLPFFGFRFNYTRISVNGYIEFSDPPSHYTYPLTFPIKDWPNQNDPSFIGIFFSKCRIGSIRPEDDDQRKPGVYFRMERDLQGRTDQPGVETRERVKWDIRTGVIGSETFNPKHAVIVTWKNISFAGGIDNSLYKTNSFQMVLATDEVYTYAIFNYVELQWSSHTEAGGDTTGGEGGVPAYIGFNAGNGTQSFEYSPYSQASILRDLTERGYANDIKGRHIFRIDEKILMGTCNKDIDGANLPLVFAPESGNMLGGTIVNITGPCFFKKTDRINCRFENEDVVGIVVDTNRAICVQPRVLAEGYVRFEVAINAENYKWKGKYFIETPATATEKIFFQTADVHEKYPAQIKITWNAANLTTNLNAGIRISLWGYKETKIRPELQYIDILEEGVQNRGEYTIAPSNYRNKDNFMTRDLQFGFIQINLTNPQDNSGLEISPVLWSRPIPLGWYFAPQWEKQYGSKWPERMCNNWLTSDRYYKNFASDVPLCPCTLEHALLDKGRFMPDFSCDKDANPKCFYNKGAVHCVRSGNPSLEGSGQQCCYDKNEYLMLSYDQQWGSRPQRAHNLGFLPWTEASKVPTLSHWFHDQVPYYQCCMWQEEQAVGCETYRFERRPTQDCVAYQPPGVGAVFGDPHLVTFDGLQYTFNGKGEFVLVRTDLPSLKLDVQGRFEQVPRNVYGPVRATQLTSIVAAGNNSAVIEVRIRPQHAQWRYRLDVFANGKRVYFDRTSLKAQHFPGVLVYTPTYILNQSEVIMMFQSGAGVEVVENQGFMSARVYLPWSYINKTRGLLGNWSWDVTDDFTKPDGTITGINLANFENAHQEFGKFWMLSDRAEDGKGAAMFTREFSRTSSYYNNASFVPVYQREPAEFLSANRTIDINRASELCGESYQCRYDYGMSLHRDMAHFTKNYYNSIINIRETNSKRVYSCGVLETPRFGRKSNFFFVPGTKVTFECNENFVLTGDQRRTCMPEGRWDVPVYGYTECLRTQEYSSRQVGMTGGIIMAVMVPLLLIIGCFWFCCLKKAKENKDSSWNFEKFEPRSLSNSRANLRSQSMGNLADNNNDTLKKPLYERQQSEPSIHKEALKNTSPSPSDEVPTKEEYYKTMDSYEPESEPKDGDTFDSDKSDNSDVPGIPKKWRKYDKSYKTHEPLVGHPNGEFPPKLWDLTEEDGESSASNAESDKTNTELSQPARDIQYINKPRQYGRRGDRAMDSGYSTTDTRSSPMYNDDTFKFDHLSPVSSTYSPSTSGTNTPSMSPNSEINNQKYSYPFNSYMTPIAIPEEPPQSSYNKLSTFGLPVSKGQSYDTLLQPARDPIQQGPLTHDPEIETFSSRTTMV